MSSPSGPHREAPGVLLLTLVFIGVCALVIAVNCIAGSAGQVTIRRAEAATAAPWICTPPPATLAEASPDDAPAAALWVLNTSSRRFHLPDCSSVPTIKEKNRADFTGTREELIDMGYKPCGNCKP